MRKVQSAIAMVAVALFLGGAGPAAAQFYTQHNLVSDGAVPAALVDPSLVNAWGLVASTGSPWWVSNNGTDSSTLYNGNTGAKVNNAAFDPACQCVHVPGAPTGVVFNGVPFTTGTGFVVTDPLNPAISGPARFIFAAEDGSISGWPGGVDHAIVAVPPSTAAVYKGLAIVSTIPGNVAGDFLYATNFRGGTVDVFNSTFVKQPAGRFVDPTIPADYGPFGIQRIGDIVYVTYALKDEDGEDDVPGMGHGFVNAFDLGGHFIRRVASRGTLNSPWGLALAPGDFGKFGRRPARRQLRQRPDQRLRSCRPARQRRIQASRHAAQRGRSAAGDRGTLGAAVWQRRKCGANKHTLLHRGSGRRIARAVRLADPGVAARQAIARRLHPLATGRRDRRRLDPRSRRAAEVDGVARVRSGPTQAGTSRPTPKSEAAGLRGVWQRRTIRSRHDWPCGATVARLVLPRSAVDLPQFSNHR